MVLPQLGLKEGEKGGSKVSQEGPMAEMIPRGRAWQPNINSKGDICMGFHGSTCRRKRAIGRN
jgi:hypothetical protein